VLLDIRKMRMKRKTIWKNINKMISWFKFFIEKRKEGEKFVILIVHINKWRFQPNSLFGHEAVDRHIMTVLFL